MSVVSASASDKFYNVAIIGSGPAGQKAAVQAAKAGQSVAIIERDAQLGGACVQRGTIPSKTLRENALRVTHMRQNAKLANFDLGEDVEMSTLINRLDEVIKAHDGYMRRQIHRNNIEWIHGRARFVDNRTLRIDRVGGGADILRADKFVIATGSFPRNPNNIQIDHEHIFDSDSILSILYLPKSLIVLGGGVIASEYASIFQALGVQVTMIDKYPRPLGFLDADLTDKFVHAFETRGGRWLGNTTVESAMWDGLSQVECHCAGGTVIKGEKLLCAAGRIANVSGLNIKEAGLTLDENGLIPVDRYLQTSVEGIYAAGDVIGPPSLASAAMEQGRRASCNALSISTGVMSDLIPAGIYSIPELSSIGLSEQQALKEHGDIIVGKANFEEIARGQISDIQDGMLKIIADSKGKKILGVAIVGEGSTELIHIGQMAMVNNNPVDVFIENIFNFPTLAEAYRVAALAIIGQRQNR